MTQTPRDWQKDMETCIEEQEREDVGTQSRWMGTMGPTIASYWLKEAKVYRQSYEAMLKYADATEARVKELEAIMKAANDENEWLLSGKADEDYGEALATLYPDTPAPKEG